MKALEKLNGTVQLVLEVLDQWPDSLSCSPCRVTCAFQYRRVPIDLALGRAEMHVRTFLEFPIQHLRSILKAVDGKMNTYRSLKRVSYRVVVISVVIAQANRCVVAWFRTVEGLISNWTKRMVQELKVKEGPFEPVFEYFKFSKIKLGHRL